MDRDGRWDVLVFSNLLPADRAKVFVTLCQMAECEPSCVRARARLRYTQQGSPAVICSPGSNCFEKDRQRGARKGQNLIAGLIYARLMGSSERRGDNQHQRGFLSGRVIIYSWPSYFSMVVG